MIGDIQAAGTEAVEFLPRLSFHPEPFAVVGCSVFATLIASHNRVIILFALMSLDFLPALHI